MNDPRITQELVKSLFNYHEDGYLVWKIRPAQNVKIGDRTGKCVNSSGYCVIKIFDKLHYAHRLIFLWHHGYLPEGLVDHRDRVKTHNWIDNLRDSTYSCNTKNSKIRSDNVTGVTGVRPTKYGKYSAHIKNNGSEIYLGTFSSIADAAMARWNKEIELEWNGCNSTSSAYLYLKERQLLPKKRLIYIPKYKRIKRASQLRSSSLK